MQPIRKIFLLGFIFIEPYHLKVKESLKTKIFAAIAVERRVSCDRFLSAKKTNSDRSSHMLS
jgi:hypothetical protein